MKDGPIQPPGVPADPAAGSRIPAAGQKFYRTFLEFIRDLPGTAKRFWILVLATGIVAGLGAVLLVALLDFVQKIAWAPADNFLQAVESSSRWRRIAVTTGAGVLVSLVALVARQPLHGHGTAGVIEAIWVKGGYLSLAKALVRGIVSIVSVGMGIPLGREGALIQTGAASGSWLARRFRIPVDQTRLLVACGASAGIAAAYNVPIGAALFGLEVLLGSFALELFGPIVICCVVATLISRVLIADHPSYIIPHYVLAGPGELLLQALVGALVGIGSAIYIRVVDSCSGLVERSPKWLGHFLPPLAGLAVGIVACWLPEILGNGYDVVNSVLLGQLSLALLLILPAAKLLGSAISAGTGIPGGMFTPSLFYGALLGGALGHVARYVLNSHSPPGAYALIGMGAVLAGTTNAPVSAVLIIFELTSDYGVILPLMLSCVLAAAVSRRLEPESLYTSVLRSQNIQLPEVPRPQWLRATEVRVLMKPNADSVTASASLEEVVLKLLAQAPGANLYVTNGSGRFLGTIVLDQIKGHLPDHSLLSAVIASDVMDSQIKAVTPEMSLSEVASRFSLIEIESLPVVDAKSGMLLGAVFKNDVLRRARF